MARSVRNPLAAFAVAIAASLALSVVALFVSTFLPYLEFRLFFLGFVLFGIGMLAGRQTFLGSLGFAGTYLGSFVGLYFGETLFWPTLSQWIEPLALVLAAACGLGGFAVGKLGLHRLIRAAETTPGLRRCHNCGNRVGASAHKCWSCKATLTY